MTDTIKVGIDLQTNIKESLDVTKLLTKELKKAAEAAKSIVIPSGSSNNAPAQQRSSTQTKAYSSAVSRSNSSNENAEYGIARGTVGTGASSRDFAKQAQGLGGLVHLYATFAANLFAVSAAFGALKQAADTTNMIKGLDQLGAASGRNLGSLSKEVVKLTDGAVSLRDAMEATAKATSAGMSDADLKRMAVGARQASQALGVSMPDALSRLSRGITKLEPELLDELGIFVRVDKAAADYARSLGKPISALTEFERRQAFAVATLDQVQKKFGDIELAANPYDKLLSSLKDVMQTGLELVNKVIGPLAKLLAESPTGLIAALAAVGGLLLKQAVPAIGSIRKGMDEAVELSRKVAVAKGAEATKAYAREKKLQASHIEAMAEKELAAVTKVQEKIEALRASGDMKKGSKLHASLDADPRDIKPKDISNLEATAKGLATRAKNEIDATRKASYAISAKVHEEGIALLKERIHTEISYDNKIKESTKSLVEQQAVSSTVGQNQSIASKANLAYISKNIAANASNTASLVGMSAAWRDMNEEIRHAKEGKVKVPIVDGQGKPLLDSLGNVQTEFKKVQDKGISATQAGFTRLKSGIGMISGVVGTAMNAFGFWGQAIAAGAVALSFLNDYLSNTTKEALETEEAIKSLASGVENVTRTLDFINKKSATEFLSVESIQARATAIGELSNSMVTMLKKADDQFVKMNWFDKTVDLLKGAFKQDLATDIGKGMGESISKAMEGIDLKKNSKALEDIRSSLGVSSLFDTKEVSAAFTKLEREGEAGRAKAAELAEQIQKIGKEGQIAAAKATEFKQSLDQTSKSFKTFSNSFIPSDTFSKLGADIMTQAQKMTLALEEPATAISAMYELTKSAENIALLPPESREIAIAMRNEIKGLSEDYSSVSKSINQNTIDLEKYEAKLRELKKQGLSDTSPEVLDVSISKSQTSNSLAGNEVRLKDIETGINTATAKFAQVSKAQFVAGAAIIGERLSAEWAKAGTAVGNTVAGILGNTKSGIELRTQYEKQQLSGQISLIKSQQELIKSNYVVAETIRLKDIGDQLLSGKSSKTGKNLEEKEIEGLQTEAVQRAQSIAAITAGKLKGLATSMSKDFNKFSQEAIQVAQSLESSGAQIAGLLDQIGSSTLKAEVDQAQLKLEEQKKLVVSEGALLSLRKEGLSLVKLDTDLLTINSVKEESKLDTLILQNKHKQESLELDKQKVAYTTVIDSKTTTTDQKSKASKELEHLKNTVEVSTKQKQIQEEINLSNKLALDIEQAKYTVSNRTNKLKQEELTYSIELRKEKLNTDKTALDFEKNNAVMSELEYTKKSFDIRRNTLALEAEERINSILASKEESVLKYKLIDAQYSLMKDQAKSRQEEYKAKAASEKDPEAKSRYENAAAISGASADSITSLAESTKAQANIVLANYDKQIERQATLNNEKYKQLAIEERSATNMSRIKDITAALSGTFASAGSDIAPLLQAFSNLYTSVSLSKDKVNELTTEQSTLSAVGKDLAVSMREAYNTDNQAEILAINESISKNDKDKLDNTKKMTKAQDESFNKGLDGTMSLLSASKKLFKEKSTANKVISAMEKAYMVYKLAMMAKEMALTMQAAMTAIVASNAKKAADLAALPASGAKAVTDSGQGDPYSGIVRVVMMLALVGAAMAMAGKSGPSGTASSFVMNSEQRQETQGTGMTYDAAGNLVETGGGVFGDTSAKSESIANSLEIMKSNSIEGLQNEGKMVRALDRMVIALTGAAEEIYKISGLRKGLSVEGGITPGSVSSSKDYFNNMGSMNGVATANKLIAGPLGDVITKAWLNSSIGQKLGNLHNKISNTVFGGKQSVDTKIVGTGIEILGTLTDLAEGTSQDLLRTYNDIVIETKKDGGWFGKDSTSTENIRQYGKLTDSATELLTDVFKNAIDLFTEYGTTLGLSNTEITKNLSSIKVSQSMDFTGLNGEEITNELSAVISTIKDDASMALFPYMEDMRNFGEGMGETVSRVIKSMLTYEQAMSNMLIPLDIVAGSEQIRLRTLVELSDYLVTQSGGLEGFVELYRNYADSFLTSQERLVPVQKEVQDTMTELGFASVDTRDEFRKLVSGLDMTTKSGADTWISLMKISKSFDEVAQAVEDLVSKVGLAASNFSSIFTDSIGGKSTLIDAGTKIVDTITDGITQALSTSFVDTITNQITNTLITPIITTVTAGTFTTQVISQQAIDSIINSAAKAATALAKVFTSTAYTDAISTLTTNLTSSMTHMAAVASVTSGSINKLLKTYSTSMTKAAENLEKAREKEKTDIINKDISTKKELISTTKSLRDKFKDFSKSLKEFSQSLLTSDLSPLTPSEKYNEANKALESTYAKALGGDEDAISKLQTVSNDFLGLSKEYYASSETYTKDFNRVREILDSVATASDAKVSDAENQISLLESTVSNLELIVASTDGMAQALLDYTKAVEDAEKAGIVTISDALVPAFSTIDKNFNGFLDIPELLATGLGKNEEIYPLLDKMDKNDDGQLSMLEAIEGSSADTNFALNGLQVIADAVLADTLPIEEARAYVESMKAANVDRVTLSGLTTWLDTYITAETTKAATIATDKANKDNAIALANKVEADRVAEVDRLSTLRNSSSGSLVDSTIQAVGGRAASDAEVEKYTGLLGSGVLDAETIAISIADYLRYESTNKADAASADAWVGGTAWNMLYAKAGAWSGMQPTEISSQMHATGNLNTTAKINEYIDAYLANKRVEAESYFSSVSMSASGGSRTLPSFGIVGEQGPEMLVTQGPSRIWSHETTKRMFGAQTPNSEVDTALLDEIRKLNIKIDSLEKTVARGDMMNAQATQHNTNEVAAAIENGASLTIHANRVKNRVSLV